MSTRTASGGFSVQIFSPEERNLKNFVHPLFDLLNNPVAFCTEPAMDWNFAIETQKEALKRVLALLVAMAGLVNAGQGTPTPNFLGGRVGCVLPRHLYRAILRLLRPAEAAARRLIVIAARGLTAQLAPSRRPMLATLPKRIVGTGIVDTGISLHQLGLANIAPPPVRKPRDASQPLALPLTDTLRGLSRSRRPTATSVPCISGSGPRAIARRCLPSSNDPVDAYRLHCRLAAIARALDDLPAEAKRLARWRALRERARARGKFQRLRPIRPGRPPGWRKPGSRHAHEVHRILHELHGLAFWALEEKPDTS